MFASSGRMQEQSPCAIGCERFPLHDRKLLGKTSKRFSSDGPSGMPLIDHLGGDLWEVRSKLDTRIARTLFVTEGATMVLLHAFIKKQQKTPKPDLNLAKERLKQLRRRK